MYSIRLTASPSISCLVLRLLFLGPDVMLAEQLPIRTYTTPEGLAHNHINRIRQDSRGYLWFCTDGGLSRFDGYRFTNYTTEDGLPHPWVNDLMETRDGSYWIATDGGVCRFNPSGTSTKSVHTADKPMFVVYKPGAGEDANRVNALVEDPSGGLWCGAYGGLYRLHRGAQRVAFEWVDIGLPRKAYLGQLVNNIAVDGAGALWIAARQGLFHRSPDGRSERYTTAQGLPDNVVEVVYQDRSGRWWIGTRGRGFCSVVSDARPDRPVTARCYSAADGLPQNDVRSIFQSSNGRLWIGTTGGLSEFSPDGPPFRNYTRANGLSTAVIYKINEDRDGNLWLGTRDGGVMRIAGGGFVTYGEQDGVVTGNADARITEGRDGELHVITSVGARGFIERFDGRKFIAAEISIPRPDPKSAVWLRPGSFQDRIGDWWIATSDGLVRLPETGRAGGRGLLRPRAIYDAAHGLTGSSISQVYQDSRGDIWIATESHDRNDLARWERVTGRIRHYGEGLPQLKDNTVTALREDASGSLWIGFDHGGGLARYRGGKFEPFHSGPEAFAGVIRSILPDHAGRIWVASTEAGLIRIDSPSSDHPRLTRYTAREGLSSNEIRCITEDLFGRIYLGTNRGVDRFDPATLQVKHYTWADGLSKGTVHFAFRDRVGALWFVTNDGISRFSPTADRPHTAPPVYITGLKIMGAPQSLSELGELQLADFVLPPSRNQLEIEFVSLDFRQAADLRYQYMLDGVDEHWSAPTDERRVLYGTLTSGRYRFLVRSVSSDGIAGPQPAVVGFVVLAPVWRRWWFITAETGLIALAIYGLYRYRLGQLLAVERMRTRIATDLHDDIGSSLSQIAILSELARRRIENGDPHLTGPLSEIATVSRELVDGMSDIVWAINPKHDRLSDLTRRMRRFANDILGGRNIELEFRAPGGQQDPQVESGIRREVFLIFKEAVNNIARHSGASRVEIGFETMKDDLILSLKDNGSGFDPAVGSDGNGLVNIRKRARDLGGELKLESAPFQGTSVTLRVPLDYQNWGGRLARR